uniref:Poly [ADP-ribose] polymerase 4 n=1 Tax=Phallusia mammillata TaxID=59560 RepID=A0A6F9DMK3_9ASCI|nr:poly [ADP-ribose] polymerase 4 [Phallusia mammillata]
MSLETVTKTPPPLPERFKACMLSPQTKKQAACLPPRLVPQSNLLARKHDALRVGGGDLNKAAAMRSSFQATRFDSFSMQMPANTGDATELSKETIEPLCDEDESFSSHDSNFSNEAETLEPPKSPPKTLPKTADPPRSFKTDKRRARSETIKSYQKLKSVQTFFTQALSRDLEPPAPPRPHPSLSANRKSLETVTKTETALQAHYSAKTKNRASLRSAQSGPQSNLFARNRDALPGGLRVRVGGGKTIARRSSHHATRLDSLSMQMPDNTDDDADIIKTYLSLYEEKENELADVLATRLCLKRIRPASKPKTIESVLQKERLYEAINNYIEKESSFPWAHAPLLNVVLKKNEALLKILKEAGASSLGPNVFNALYEMVRVAVIAKVLKELNCKNDDVKDKQRQKIVSTQMTWLKKMDSIYPSLYSRLELGKDWEDAANNILQTLLAGLKPEKAINDLFFSFE